ncbi:hypothetical protein ACP70R_003159 [Stipagrostis hirtigluma subsp. patula]
MPTLAASSTSSCSPPEARHSNLRSKRRLCCAKASPHDDCLDNLSDIIKDLKERMSRRTTEAEEMAKVRQILKEDGYSESDLFFAQALSLCTNRLHRRNFLDLETKEGRLNYVKVSWEVMILKMDSNDDSSVSDTSSEGPDLKNLAKAVVMLRRIKSLLAKQPPVAGRYYSADSGYMEQQGYMTPFRDTWYHNTHFKGIDVRTLDRQKKFNYIHSKLRNVIERRFGYLKERTGFHSSGGKASMCHHILLCNGQLLVAAYAWRWFDV